MEHLKRFRECRPSFTEVKMAPKSLRKSSRVVGAQEEKACDGGHIKKRAIPPPTWLFGHHHPGRGVCLPSLAHNTFGQRKKTPSSSTAQGLSGSLSFRESTAARRLSFHRTFYRLVHRVSHEGGEVFCCDGGVSLGHQAVRPLPRALCEGQMKQKRCCQTGTYGAHMCSGYYCVSAYSGRVMLLKTANE